MSDVILTSNESNVASERFQAMLDEECNHCGKLRRNCNYWLVNELGQTRLWWKQDKDRLTAHETSDELPRLRTEIATLRGICAEQLVCRKCGSSDVMPWPTAQKAGEQQS